MKKTNYNDDFSNRKDFRRKQLDNKSLDRKDKNEDANNNSSKIKKQLKRQIEDMKADELWEDWENNYEN
jgi:hypothetical protein